jgi:hypothetical protein
LISSTLQSFRNRQTQPTQITANQAHKIRIFTFIAHYKDRLKILAELPARHKTSLKWM